MFRFLALLTSALAAIFLPAADDQRNVDPNGPKTHFALKPYTRVGWEARREHLRKQILSAAGLLPMLHRGPLNPRIVRTFEDSRFVVETLTLETLPGYTVGANLYRPKVLDGKAPVVLIPHGHWKQGRVTQIEQYSVPALAANLAMQGFVAIAWDMVGYNDTRQTPHDFSGWREQLWAFNPLGLQLWNSIRILDYLETRPEVDPNRVAITGASGGGTQTFLLTAVDPRIKLSAPVNMVSAHYQGGDPCEEAPNLRLNGAQNVEFTAMTAPRPLLLISCTRDWTKNTPQVEFPAIQQIYEVVGAAGRARNHHFDAPHNYNAASRNAFYDWLHSHWGKPGTSPPIDVPLMLPPDRLLAGLPDRESEYQRVFEQWRKATNGVVPTTDTESLRAQLRFALGAEVPDAPEFINSDESSFLRRPGAGDHIPAIHHQGTGRPVLLVHPHGARAAAKTPIYEKLRVAGRPVLLIDTFQTGRAKEHREKNGRWFLGYNRSKHAERVQDLLTALSFLRSSYSDTPEIIASGQAATWALFAAAVDPQHVMFDSSSNPLTGSDEEMKEHFPVPGIQRAGGIAAAVTILSRQNRSSVMSPRPTGGV